jgi:beta-lactamase class A
VIFIYNLSHGATAVQAARFYYLLETHQLLDLVHSEKMKEILSKPGISHKFVKGLAQVPGIEIYRKSGTWKNYHADSAMVESKDHRYIIVGLSDSAQGGKWLEQLGLPLHKMITGE